MLDLAHAAPADTIDLPGWSAAEILDASLPDHNLLRAAVVRLGAGKWQWSVSSLEDDRGELISVGIAKTAAAARDAASAEIAKCLSDTLS